MLTISKPLSASQAQNYHAKEFTAKEQNYWSQRGVIAGEWQGRWPRSLALPERYPPRNLQNSARAASGNRRAAGAATGILRVSGRRRQDRQDDGAPRRLGCDIFRAEIRLAHGFSRRR